MKRAIHQLLHALWTWIVDPCEIVNGYCTRHQSELGPQPETCFWRWDMDQY